MKAAALFNGNVKLVESVELADSLPGRIVGLLGRAGLDRQKAIHLVPCNSIHTFFMRFKIDLVFLSRDMVVTKIVSGVRPWRIVLGGRGAASVIEMQSGWFSVDELSVGDQLTLKDQDSCRQ